jgi:hypothetical protein
MQILSPEIAAASGVASRIAESVEQVQASPAIAVDTSRAVAGLVPIESDEGCPNQRERAVLPHIGPPLPPCLFRFWNGQIACTVNEFIRLSGEKRNHCYDHLFKEGEVITFLSGSRRMVLLPSYFDYIGRRIEAEQQGRIRSIQANNIDRKDLKQAGRA